MVNDALPAILIADDDSDDEFLIRRRLSQVGIANPVLSFPDGADLVEFLEKKPAASAPAPRLLLLDLKMPRMDGFDTLRWIRERPAFNGLKVVVITSSNREQDSVQAVSCGASRVLVKFPSRETLAEIVAASV